MLASPGTGPRKMRLLPLVAATFMMVAGGPYGIEDILAAGYGWAILILLVLPFVWCLPTALMIGEMASAIPANGGFYVWVRRALGPFWGYQEGWLSLSASIFDMAIFPALFVSYLGKFYPALTDGWREMAWKLAVVVLCCVWNLRGAPAIGNDSVWMSALLLAPFGVFVGIGFLQGFTHHAAIHWDGPGSESALSTSILVAMWNYMGWDDASTVAQEVENPQRTYPRAMIAATILTAVTFILPPLAIAVAGLSVESFSTGDWVTAARAMGGPWLGTAVAAGGVIMGVGMFNALVMSFTRLPMAMAQEGMLPRALALCNRRRVPWVSVLFCGLAWALALNLTFERLITIDLILYGSSLLLEFIALVVLRIREPSLHRPFKAGNLGFAIALGVLPAVLIGYALYASRAETVKLGHRSMPAMLFSVLVGLLGPVLYWVTVPRRRKRALSAEPLGGSAGHCEDMPGSG